MNKVFDNIIYRSAVVILLMMAFSACEPSFDFYSEFDGHSASGSINKDMGGREIVEEPRNVLLLYSAGFNSLSTYLAGDINDLISGDIPTGSRSKDVLLIYSHLPIRKGAYSQPNSPILMRVYKDMWGEVVKDTLLVCPETTHSADPSQLKMILNYVKDNFPAKTYGMIFSSHATGYLPTGYYSSPGSYVYTPALSMMTEGAGGGRGVPYVEPEYDPSFPMVKSVGQDQVGTYGSYISYEIQIEEFAQAIPMYLDYILFDACLMGGIEVAYELREKCGLVGFSQTEVLAEGFDYAAIPTHLLSGEKPDPAAVCMDYFKQYDVQTGLYRSATISLVDCSRLEPIAEICAELFRKYASKMAKLNPKTVQGYFRGEFHWFYDLVDIVLESGATEEELAALNEAVEDCMVYRASTPEFMESIEIETYSGFSMYLPCDGGVELDKYYRNLQWNIATGLVE